MEKGTVVMYSRKLHVVTELTGAFKETHTALVDAYGRIIFVPNEDMKGCARIDYSLIKQHGDGKKIQS